MEEVWKDIKDFNGYQVSDNGIVKSLARKLNNQFSNQERIKPQYEKKSGMHYLYVNLAKNGKMHSKNVHQLVAHAFPEICGEYFEGAQIDHLNGDPHDNRAVNLRFVSATQNQRNPISQKRQREAKLGEKNPMYGKRPWNKKD